MKIMYILPYNWGGIPHYTAEISNAVSEYEEVVVLGGKDINTTYFSDNIKMYKIFEKLRLSNKSVFEMVSLNNLISMLSFKNISVISRIDPDIIHLTSPLILPLMIFIKIYRYDKKYSIIYTKHSVVSGANEKMKILDNIVYYSERYLNFKNIILHTENDRKLLMNTKQISPTKLTVIPHGTYSFFRKFNNTYSNEKNTILFFGRICSYKGLQYLIDAVPLVSKRIPDLKVIIAGEGDLSPYLSFINENKRLFEIHNEFISDEKVSELFQRTELLVLPYSEMSGQSGVLNIALAFNKPVVASNVGDIKDIVADGITGFLVPPKDPEVLAEAIIKVLNNSLLQNEMKVNMEVKSQDLSWDSIARKHIKLYNEILRG